MKGYDVLTPSQVRALPEGTRVRQYGAMKRGLPQWVEGEVKHLGLLKTEVVVKDFLGIMHIPVKAYKNKFWARKAEEQKGGQAR
jgi:hypothetical protein